MKINERLAQYEKWIDAGLNDTLSKGLSLPQRKVFESMLYSVGAGGKRLRPKLMLLFCYLAGGEEKKVLPFAIALEMIHTYSLIHDDLPCMDDDDLRRGKPTNHKVFGEAIATLAGDGLLGLAFETALSADSDAETKAKATYLLARYSGAYGMLGGQILDIEEKVKTEQELLSLYEKKTSCLLECACEIGTLVGGGDKALQSHAKAFGENLGIAFQICDDILDVVSDEATLGKPIGSDREQNKTTFVTLFGVEGAGEKAEFYTQKAKEEAKAFPESELLLTFCDSLLKRKN